MSFFMGNEKGWVHNILSFRPCLIFLSFRCHTHAVFFPLTLFRLHFVDWKKCPLSWSNCQLCFISTGLILCLVFNIIAVIVCWIKGGGKDLTCSIVRINGLMLCCFIQKSDEVLYSRCQNFLPCVNICFTWCSAVICTVVSTTLSCNEVVEYALSQTRFSF